MRRNRHQPSSSLRTVNAQRRREKGVRYIQAGIRVINSSLVADTSLELIDDFVWRISEKRRARIAAKQSAAPFDNGHLAHFDPDPIETRVRNGTNRKTNER